MQPSADPRCEEDRRQRAALIAPGRAAFTLVELIVVVAIIAVISGVLLPVLAQARDRARRAAEAGAEARPKPEHAAPPPAAPRPALPSGPAPVVDALDLRMSLRPSYHRIGMDVFTRYRLDCAGRAVFRHPGNTGESRVLFVLPFPEDIVEARDVELVVRPVGAGAGAAVLPGDALGDATPLTDVVYDRSGIYGTCRVSPGRALAADVRFTAFGRERFDYALPPARQLRSVSVTLDLPGAAARVVPDESLQPSSAAGADRLRWEFRNLVSDRRISVVLPGAQAPLARVLLLSRLVAAAVLLFGAGFWFLSEQAKPGQLDRFRLGHFLLLALTYSLFFVIFAVLEFHGRLATPGSMAVSAALSLPLLFLHVSRVLDVRFALTRVVPLALFTLAMAVNGVYGGPARDYVFLGAAVCVIAYATVSYPSWAAGRDRRRREEEAGYAARRGALAAEITAGVGARTAALARADAQAAGLLESSAAEGPGLAAARARLEGAREPVGGLRKEYEELAKRLSQAPRRAGGDAAETLDGLERDADALRDRSEAALAHLRGEVAAYHQEARKATTTAKADGSSPAHCVACGRGVPDAPFCPHCGTARPAAAACPACGERMVVPVHLLGGRRQASPLFCARCGTRVPVSLARPAPDNSEETPGRPQVA